MECPAIIGPMKRNIGGGDGPAVGVEGERESIVLRIGDASSPTEELRRIPTPNPSIPTPTNALRLKKLQDPD